MKSTETLQEAPVWHRHVKNCLRLVLGVTTCIYPLFMGLMSAAGWQYNVNAGNYPALFSTFATWMTIGCLLLAAGTVLSFFGMKHRFWRCNVIALACGVPGVIAAMTVLHRFTLYADQNFPGHRETMQPISEIYRDRLLPILLPFGLLCVICLWQLFAYDARVYRSEQKKQQNAEAPSILGDDK
ncbi:MAG: hypothetical protein IJN57_10900 [Oscillospiraceae bacterium]|nr:hypothetical protein [Oscillospiraceae bacterium]